MNGAGLFLVLVLAKALAVAGSGIAVPAWSLPAWVGQDALVALAFEALRRAVRRPVVRGAVYGAVVLYAAANVPVARTLGTTLTAPMLGAAGTALTDSILRYATAGNLALVALVLAAGALAPFLIRPARWTVPSLAGLALAGALVAPAVPTRGLHRTALVALIETSFPRVAAHEGEGIDHRAPLGPAAPAPDLRRLRGAARGRDVVLVILESAGAGYLRPWGADADPMPNLTRLAERGITISDAYAVYPESVKGLTAILGSLAPAMDTPVERYAGIRFETIASRLAAAGYRTALFHSGRFDYLGMAGVVRDRGFETLEDAGAIGAGGFASFGAEESETVARCVDWVRRLDSDERFLLVYMPIAGHHPYDSPEPGPFPKDREVDVYRNALHYADASLGRLLDGLDAEGRLDTSLVVVVGDHGQAFRQHPGNYGHTFFLYDENVRVPLVFAAPGAIGGGNRIDRVASHLDVLPTVLDLLGLELPGGLGGQSLLDPEPRAALFFTDYGLALLGLRDGPRKVIHEVGSGRTEVYDVATDPGETRDLSAERPALVERARERLLAWAAARRAALRR